MSRRFYAYFYPSDFSYTLGTEIVIADFGTGGNTTVGYIDNTNKVVFTYKKNSDDYTYAKVGTVESNGSITLGSEVSIFIGYPLWQIVLVREGSPPRLPKFLSFNAMP